jgi:hypothetical protein
MLRRGPAVERRERTGEIRVRAFRATDAFVLEAFRATFSLKGEHTREVAREIRSSVVRCGCGLVAASETPRRSSAELRCLQGAKNTLTEARYALYLARRFGFLDMKTYRALTARHEAASREIDSALERSRSGSGDHPP